MPYIKQEDKEKFRDMITKIPEFSSSGELNYILTSICLRYIKQKGCRYALLNDVIGALQCVILEFYRRLVSPYENLKKCQNGEVYTDEYFRV